MKRKKELGVTKKRGSDQFLVTRRELRKLRQLGCWCGLDRDMKCDLCVLVEHLWKDGPHA